MFTLIENYKNMFMAFIRNEFAEVQHSTIDSEAFETNDAVEELEALRTAVKNLRDFEKNGNILKINAIEASQIVESYDKIEDETRD